MKKLLIILMLGLTTLGYAEEQDANLDIETINSEMETQIDTEVDTEQPTYEKYMSAGDQSYNEGDYSDSLDYYLGAFKLKDKDKAALFGAAKSYEKIGNTTEAIGVYRKVLKLYPRDIEAERQKLRLEGKVFSNWSFHTQEKYFTEYEHFLAKTHYKNGEDIYQLGKIYMNDNSFERAFKVFKKDKTGDYRNYFGAATTARFLGKPDVSITYYEKMIAIKPDFYRAYLGIGIAYQLNKDYDLAIENLEKYLTYHNDPNVFVTISNIYTVQGEIEKAKSTLERGQKEFPNSRNIRKALGDLYSKTRRSNN